jgi:signal transduction histidine kinase
VKNPLKNSLKLLFSLDFKAKFLIISFFLLFLILFLTGYHLFKENLEISFTILILIIDLFTLLIFAGLYQFVIKPYESLIKNEKTAREIITIMLENETLEKAVYFLNKMLCEIFFFDRAIMRIYDKDTGTFNSSVGEYRRNTRIYTSENKDIYSLEGEKYISKNVIEKNEILFIPDIKEVPPLKEMYKSINMTSAVYVPVVFQNKPLGIISLTSVDPVDEFSQKNRKLLYSLLSIVSLGVNRFLTNKKLSKTLSNERILRDLLSESTKIHTIEELQEYILKKVSKLFGTDINFIFMPTGEYKYTVTGEYLVDRASCLNKEILCEPCYKEVFPSKKKKMLVITDTELETKYKKLVERCMQFGLSSFILYPFSKSILKEKNEEYFALILLGSSAKRSWTEEETDFLKVIVDTMSFIYLEISGKEELERTRQSFIATLTHDLRSPILAEQKGIEYMLSDIPKTGQAVKEYFEEAYNLHEELLRLINNLLAVYSFERGEFEIEIRPHNPKELVMEVVSTLKYLAIEKKSELSVNFKEPLNLVNCDGQEIKRVLTNLVSNAIKHNAQGTKVMISVKSTKTKMLFAVCDNGAGISEEEKSRIFQRYPTKKRHIASGLGLYASKKIIDLHNEKIWFKSKIGEGTTFYFTLPVSQKP